MKVITKPSSKAARGRNLTLTWGIHDFPVGRILVALSAEGLCWLGIDCDGGRLAKTGQGAKLVEDPKATRKAAAEIAKLWPENLEELSIPLVLYGTPFQLKVWRELLKIKSGSLSTYQAVAHKIGKPKAARAVGSAVGRNTVSIVVPCHRVVNKDLRTHQLRLGTRCKAGLAERRKSALTVQGFGPCLRCICFMGLMSFATTTLGAGCGQIAGPRGRTPSGPGRCR